jgi:hypothetical protein
MALTSITSLAPCVLCALDYLASPCPGRDGDQHHVFSDATGHFLYPCPVTLRDNVLPFVAWSPSGIGLRHHLWANENPLSDGP